MTPEQREEWAKLDGFSNFDEAHEWFMKTHEKYALKAKVPGLEVINIMDTEFDVIRFEPLWVNQEVIT